MTCINRPPCAAFVECAEVNVFNTTLRLPPEAGQQSVTSFVAGKEMNNLSGQPGRERGACGIQMTTLAPPRALIHARM